MFSSLEQAAGASMTRLFFDDRPEKKKRRVGDAPEQKTLATHLKRKLLAAGRGRGRGRGYKMPVPGATNPPYLPLKPTLCTLRCQCQVRARLWCRGASFNFFF